MRAPGTIDTSASEIPHGPWPTRCSAAWPASAAARGGEAGHAGAVVRGSWLGQQRGTLISRKPPAVAVGTMAIVFTVPASKLSVAALPETTVS